MNLLCAEGLPGAENLNVQDCLKNLNDWAAQVKQETQRHEYHFNEHPEQFRNSLGYYRMMMLGTVLVQDLGIQYNPQLALPRCNYVMAIINTVFWWMAGRCLIRTPPELSAMNAANRFRL